jgi:hypothetical protein
MTKFPSSLLGLFLLAGCASSSGVPVASISEPNIAAAYIPLHRGGPLGHAEGAAVAIAPGVAVTNDHNRILLPADLIIAMDKDYDLLFFRNGSAATPVTAEPKVGEAVTAYGQGADADLRLAHGVVRSIQTWPNAQVPAFFSFTGDAGPGFSGGPVLDASGALIGITFGYTEDNAGRVIYAYPMARVRSEYSALVPAPKKIGPIFRAPSAHPEYFLSDTFERYLRHQSAAPRRA